MFETRHQPVLPRRRFFARVLRSSAAAAGIVLGSLGIGVCGYRYLERLSWLDALLNASMILSSMGPVTPLTTDAGKWFASLYALFSGVAFITIAGVLLAPVVHRLFHTFHVGLDGDDPDGATASRERGHPRVHLWKAKREQEKR
jgi:hypothetical protein